MRKSADCSQVRQLPECKIASERELAKKRQQTNRLGIGGPRKEARPAEGADSWRARSSFTD